MKIKYFRIEYSLTLNTYTASIAGMVYFHSENKEECIAYAKKKIKNDTKR